MSFLNLWALWIAAAVVPVLLILYFLKLRRREQQVPSTLLWKRAVQDLQVNAPFQRLRKNLLLLLQLLILALAITALARPIVETTVAGEERVVLLIDNSASMNTIENDGRTRLEKAKDQAVRLVKTLNRGTRGWSSLFSLTGADTRTQVMVIAFSNRARIVSPFTSNTGEVEALIREIQPSDTSTSLAEALQLAEAYTAPPTMTTDKTPISAAAPARLVLISDGRVADIGSLVLKQGTMEWHKIGETDDNVAVTSLRARRNYETPELVNALFKVHNFGAAAVETDVSLYIDGTLATTQRINLGARRTDESSTDGAGKDEEVETPDSVSREFNQPVPQAAVIEVRLSRDDALAVDNSALVVIPPARRLRVLVVTQQNSLIDAVLSGLPLEEFPFISPEEWEANPDQRYEKDGQATFDVVIFDKYQPQRLPAGNYLLLRALPPLEGFAFGEPIEFHQFVWWDETHPILRHAALEYVYIGESLRLTIPEQAEILAEGPGGPVLVRYAEKGRHCVVLSFAIENSTWWTKESFAVFMYNVIRYLGAGGAEVERGPAQPGDTLRIPVPAGEDQITIIGPDEERITRSPDTPGVVHFGATDRAGLYRVEGGVPGRDRFAVNLHQEGGGPDGNGWESNIAPPEGIKLEGREVQQVAAIRTATPEIWRWFVGAALALVLIEWWIYNRRVMI